MKYVKTALILAAICAVAAIVLATLNMVTEPAIEKYEEQKVLSALESVSNGMDIGEMKAVDDGYVTYMYPLTKNGKTSGYILGLSSIGYGGELGIIASFDTDGLVMNAILVSDSETPGVGKKAEAKGYMDKFVGTGSASIPVPTSKSMLSDVDAAAVSGATITFTGITKALSAGSAYVRSL